MQEGIAGIEALIPTIHRTTLSAHRNSRAHFLEHEQLEVCPQRLLSAS